MKILFCLSPWNEKRHVPSYTTCSWIRRIDQFFFANGLCEKEEVEFALICSEYQLSFFEKNYSSTLSKIQHVAVLKDDDIDIFESNYDVPHRWFSGEYTEEQRETISNLITGELPVDYTPDLHIKFFHKAPYVDQLYPESCALYFGEGGLTRAPYPEALGFDIGGMLDESFLCKDCDKIMQRVLTDKQSILLETFKSAFRNKLSKKNPFNKLIETYRCKYDKLALLPLQLSGRPSFDCICDFSDQIEYLHNVLRATPNNIGVVVTEHPKFPVITTSLDAYLREIYPNYIYHTDFLLYSNSSQYLLENVDCCVAISSSVGFHTLIWDKPLITLGITNLSPLSDGNLNEIEDIKFNVRKNSVLHYLITRCWITIDYLDNADWLYMYLEKLCSTGEYPLIDEEAIYINHLIDSAPEYTLQRKDLYDAMNTIDKPLALDKISINWNYALKRCVKRILGR